MCGLESLDQAMRGAPKVAAGAPYSPEQVQEAVASLFPAQTLNRVTRAVHAAGFVQPGHAPLVREDVGRHNALDKLGGAMVRAGVDPASGLLVMTSRVSVELVQKAARIGIPILVAVSAPTALALRVADQAGITVAGIARDDGFEVFTHPDRIRPKAAHGVA
jgi:FdhD protein